MKRFGQVAVAAVALMATARVASAQLPLVPNYPVETGLGASIAADYGDPQGVGKAYGLTAGVGFSRFGLAASVGTVDFGSGPGSSATSFGGRLGMKLVGGGLNPVSVGLQVGAGSFSINGTRTSQITPGAFIKVSPPLFPLKPFGQVYYLVGTNRPDEARFVVGANFNLLFGLGLHAAYDWGDKNKGGSAWGVGAHFNFRIPGVPMVPGV